MTRYPHLPRGDAHNSQPRGSSRIDEKMKDPSASEVFFWCIETVLVVLSHLGRYPQVEMTFCHTVAMLDVFGITKERECPHDSSPQGMSGKIWWRGGESVMACHHQVSPCEVSNGVNGI